MPKHLRNSVFKKLKSLPVQANNARHFPLIRYNYQDVCDLHDQNKATGSLACIFDFEINKLHVWVLQRPATATLDIRLYLYCLQPCFQEKNKHGSSFFLLTDLFRNNCFFVCLHTSNGMFLSVPMSFQQSRYHSLQVTLPVNSKPCKVSTASLLHHLWRITNKNVNICLQWSFLLDKIKLNLNASAQRFLKSICN